jgi:ribosomal protein L20
MLHRRHHIGSECVIYLQKMEGADEFKVMRLSRISVSMHTSNMHEKSNLHELTTSFIPFERAILAKPARSDATSVGLD